MRRTKQGAFAAGLALAGCSDGTLDSQTLFSDAIDTVVIEVDYATGAEPYTGEVAGVGDSWSIFGENADRIFGGTKTIDYPNRLEQMEALNDVEGTSYSVDDILDIADRHRDVESSGSTATFYFVWLDGFFRDDGVVNENVIGVSIGTTGVIAMFKPVVESISLPGGSDALERFAEQTTVVHEFGHAVGLVNNGVPLTSDHHDAENGAHCTNRDCVMYWANEGVRDLIPFVQSLLASGTTLVFGAECLGDVDALTDG
jgi:predicted Zn-dependent protease